MDSSDKSELTFDNLGLLGEKVNKSRSKSAGYQFDLVNRVRELGDRLSLVSKRQSFIEEEVESVTEEMMEWNSYISKKAMPEFPKYLNKIEEYLIKLGIKVYELHKCNHNEVAWAYCFVAICGVIHIYNKYIREDIEREKYERETWRYYGMFALKGLGVVGTSVLVGEVVVGLLGLKLKWM